MAAPSISWKRGSTFAASVVYTPGSGDPSDLTGVTVESSVMDHAQKRYPLTITVTSPTTFDVRYDGDSSNWAQGTAAIDYKCLLGGVVFYSTTARFIIDPQVTL